MLAEQIQFLNIILMRHDNPLQDSCPDNPMGGGELQSREGHREPDVTEAT